MGVSHYHGVELELLEPGQGSDVFRRSVDSEGRIVVHHLAYLVDDLDVWIKKFITAGFDIYIRGTNKIGPAQSEFIYMDTEKQTGFVIEFFSRRCCGLRWWPLGAIYKIIARLQKWTGRRCLSV